MRDLLQRDHVLPATLAIRMLLPVLAGLSCAHARGIVHRDLKPDNIFLATDDAGRVEPKIVDFGIAKFEGSSSRLTTAGVILGSPSYMSPEQSMGEDDIDLRADVWASAVVLYEAIAGRTPWEAPNCPALLRAIVDDAPPSLIGLGGVDAELWAIIELGLAKRREDRWSSSHELGRALAMWLAKTGVAEDISGTSLKTTWLAGPKSIDVRRSMASIGIPLAASLLLFQAGFRNAHISAASTVAAGSMAINLPVSRAATNMESSELGGACELPTADTGNPASVAGRGMTADRPAKASRSVSNSLHLSVGKAPRARPGSARAMDFGF